MQYPTNGNAAAELRAAMARKDFTTTELAGTLGVTAMWLSRRLRGITPLTVEDFGRICQALDVDPASLLDLAKGPVAS